MILRSIPSVRHSWQETTPWKTIKHSKTSSAKSSPLQKEMQLESILRKNNTLGLHVFFVGECRSSSMQESWYCCVCVFRTINVHSTMRTLAGWRFVSLDGSTGIFRRTADHPWRGGFIVDCEGPPARYETEKLLRNGIGKKQKKHLKHAIHSMDSPNLQGFFANVWIQFQGPPIPPPSSTSCLDGTTHGTAVVFFGLWWKHGHRKWRWQEV